MGINGNDVIAKSSENYISVKRGCSKILHSFRFMNAGLDEISTTITSFGF